MHILVRVIIINSLDAPRRILETLSSGQIYKQNPKKQKKKKTTGWFFLNPDFFQPCLAGGRAALAHCCAQVRVGAEEQAA